MNTELLLALIPALAIVLLIVGVYKSGFEKKDKAQDHIGNLIGEKRNQNSARQEQGMFSKKDQSDKILKRRKKKGDKETFQDRLDIQLERANMAISPNEFIMISVGSAVAGALLIKFVFAQSLLIAIPSGIGCTFLPLLFLKIKTFLRMKKATAQFPDVIDSMVNGFKSGYGFSKAVNMVSENYDDPWGTEFGKMGAEMNLGLTLDDALNNFGKRMPSPDVDLFITAILIQKETGGNMTELLGNLSKTCRDRFKLFQKVGALSAQGKLSAGIICCVPFLLSSMMFLFLPEPTQQFFSHPIGIVLLIITGFWMVCGIFVLFKIAQIEV